MGLAPEAQRCRCKPDEPALAIICLARLREVTPEAPQNAVYLLVARVEAQREHRLAKLGGVDLAVAVGVPIGEQVGNLAGCAGQRVAQRTEHDGIQDRPSTLVHAAPGGNSAMAGIVGGSTAADRIAAMKARRGI